MDARSVHQLFWPTTLLIASFPQRQGPHLRPHTTAVTTSAPPKSRGARKNKRLKKNNNTVRLSNTSPESARPNTTYNLLLRRVGESAGWSRVRMRIQGLIVRRLERVLAAGVELSRV